MWASYSQPQTPNPKPKPQTPNPKPQTPAGKLVEQSIQIKHLADANYDEVHISEYLVD